MFLGGMRHQSVTAPPSRGIDWKALGYLISIVSVFFLGAIAWPRPDAPWWHLPALIVGMATSILGMACRYVAHLHQKREIGIAQAEARKG
jgi:hypothetical protein